MSNIHVTSKVLLGILYLISVFASEEWETWKVKYGKVYTNRQEELYRRLLWERRLDYVRHHNNRVDKLFSLHLNHFADSDTPQRQPYIRRQDDMNNEISNNIFSKAVNAPSSFDWRKRGVIGEVHDQSVFLEVLPIVAGEMIASRHAIDLGILYDLSAEEISECGCSQEEAMDDIFRCIHEKIPGGLCTNSTYHSSNFKCNKGSCSPVAQINGTVFIPPGNEVMMGSAILKSPLMVYVDASKPSFELYQSGIYHDSECSQIQLDHVLQIVGYGERNGVKYWICRNTWGHSWGMNGYIWIKRGENMCGIAAHAVYPY